MTPYYQRDGVTLYHGDAREVVEALALREWLLVTDPPYGTGARLSGVTASWDVAPNPTWLADLVPRAVAVFGYPWTLTPWMAAFGVPSSWIVWWPTNGVLRGCHQKSRPIIRETEHVAVFGSAIGEARIQRSKDGSRLAASFGRIGATRKAPDVWRDAAPGLAFNAPKRQHPNEKPVSLMSKLIGLLGGTETVVDPYAGSGTTLLAAAALGRTAIGVEQDERYCEVAARRLGHPRQVPPSSRGSLEGAADATGAA